MKNSFLTIRGSLIAVVFTSALLLFLPILVPASYAQDDFTRMEIISQEEQESYPTLQKIDPSVFQSLQESVEEGEEPDEEVLDEIPQGQQDDVLNDIKELLEERERREALEALQDQELTEEPLEETGPARFLSEYWVQVWAMVAGLLGVLLAISGFSFANRKKKKSLSHFMNEIDDTFDSFKWKSKRCEAELYRLQDVMDEKLKKGKIDESTYNLLVGRIEKYIKEVQEVHDPVREEEAKSKNKK